MCSEKSWDILSFMSCYNFICIPWIYSGSVEFKMCKIRLLKSIFCQKKCISCNVFVILSDISITLKVRFTFGWEFEVWNLTSLIFKTFIVQFDIVVSDLNLHPYMFLMSIIWNRNQWVVCVWYMSNGWDMDEWWVPNR